MKVLVACEFSGIVREAFRAKGHDAMSVDLLRSELPGKHYQGDIADLFPLGKTPEWDLMIAFPPCTHLAISGARYFAQKRKDGTQAMAIDFFMRLAHTRIRRICIENPIGIMSTFWRKPDQIIQPWQFGHPESKKTCLWLKHLPPLYPTKVLALHPRGYWNNQTPSGQNKLGPSPTRAQDRGRTYQGIADAMAEQWGKLD